MRWLCMGALTLVVSNCHLAEDATGTQCSAGMHVAQNNVCTNDIMDGPSIVISAGTSCAPPPASITVAPNASFRFQNDDGTDHMISGSDGMLWVVALSNQASPYIGITKVG